MNTQAEINEIVNKTYITPPRDVHLTTSDGVVITDIEVYKYKRLESYHFSCVGDNIIWSYTPAFPKGISYYEKYKYFNGLVEEIYPKTTYTITATNQAGSSEATFTLQIKDCEYGSFLLATSGSYMGLLRLSKDGKPFTQLRVYSNYNGEKLCIPYDNYQYEYSCNTDTVNCFCYVHDENDRVFLSVAVINGKNATGVMQMTVTSKPVITTELPLIVLPGSVSANIFFHVDGIHTDPVIKPALPGKATFDVMQSSIIGSFVTKGLYHYTISTSNSMGTSSIEIDIAIDACFSNLTLLKFSEGFYDTKDMVIVEDMSGKEVHRHMFSSSNAKFNLCMEDGDYTVVMTTSFYTGSWPDPNGLSVYDEDDEFWGLYRLNNGQGEQRENLSIKHLVPKKSVIKHVKDEMEEWKKLKLKEKGWKEATLGQWGSFGSAVTVYFRKHFDVMDPSRYGELIVDLLLVDGAVAYINGVEAFRRNMPYGSISSKTMASSSYDVAIFRRTTMSTSSLVKGDNVVAVEIHRSINTISSAAISFDMHLQVLSSYDYLHSHHYLAYDNLKNPDFSHSALMAFDGYDGTYWLGTALPAKLWFVKLNDSMIIVNRLTMYHDGEGKHIAYNFRIYGIIDENNKDLLGTMHSKTLLRRDDRYVSIRLDSHRPYNSYEFEFIEASDENVVAANFQLWYSPEISCVKRIGRQSTVVGTAVIAKCPMNRVGTRRWRCDRDRLNPKWLDDQTQCLPMYPKRGYSFIDSSFIINNMTVVQWKETGRKLMIDVVRSAIPVMEKEILFSALEDCTNDEIFAMSVRIRFILEIEISDYIMKHINTRFIARISGLYGEIAGKRYGIISVVNVEAPSIHNPIPVVAIVCITLVSLIVLGLISVYLIVRGRSRREKSLLYSLKKDISLI